MEATTGHVVDYVCLHSPKGVRILLVLHNFYTDGLIPFDIITGFPSILYLLKFIVHFLITFRY